MRPLLFLLLAAFLAIVGVWPPAAAPIEWLCSGVSVVMAAVPGPVLIVAAVVWWRRSAPGPVAKSAGRAV